MILLVLLVALVNLVIHFVRRFKSDDRVIPLQFAGAPVALLAVEGSL